MCNGRAMLVCTQQLSRFLFEINQKYIQGTEGVLTRYQQRSVCNAGKAHVIIPKPLLCFLMILVRVDLDSRRYTCDDKVVLCQKLSSILLEAIRVWLEGCLCVSVNYCPKRCERFQACRESESLVSPNFLTCRKRLLLLCSHEVQFFVLLRGKAVNNRCK